MLGIEPGALRILGEDSNTRGTSQTPCFALNKGGDVEIIPCSQKERSKRKVRGRRRSRQALTCKGHKEGTECLACVMGTRVCVSSHVSTLKPTPGSVLHPALAFFCHVFWYSPPRLVCSQDVPVQCLLDLPEQHCLHHWPAILRTVSSLFVQALKFIFFSRLASRKINKSEHITHLRRGMEFRLRFSFYFYD